MPIGIKVKMSQIIIIFWRFFSDTRPATPSSTPCCTAQPKNYLASNYQSPITESIHPSPALGLLPQHIVCIRYLGVNLFALAVIRRVRSLVAPYLSIPISNLVLFLCLSCLCNFICRLKLILFIFTAIGCLF